MSPSTEAQEGVLAQKADSGPYPTKTPLKTLSTPICPVFHTKQRRPDFFEAEDFGSLPSQSLDDVFKEMAKSWSVEIRWLGVNATKGIDHKPKDRFEVKAAAALESGEKEFEQIEAGHYRYVGMIRLQNECLKCHVPDRTTLEDRVAGLSISFPLRTE